MFVIHTAPHFRYFFMLWSGSDPSFSAEMFSQSKQQTQKLWMWRMEYLHHEQRPLYFGEWF